MTEDISQQASISVRTETINGIAGVMGSHSSVVFRIGELAVAIDGASFNTATAQMVSTATLADLRLKALVEVKDSGPKKSSSGSSGGPLATDDIASGSEVIFKGDNAAVYQMMAKALEAANYINQKDIQYSAVGFLVPAQNCNSVTNTLVNAMGLAHHLPETSKLNVLATALGVGSADAPAIVGDGKDRHLLPPGWTSQFEGLADRVRANDGKLLEDDKRAISELILAGHPQMVRQQMIAYNEACADPAKRDALLGPDVASIDTSALCRRNNGFLNAQDHAARPADQLQDAAQQSVLARVRATDVAAAKPKPPGS